MGWSIGFDSNWQRDIGYGVPATCDHPACNTKIDRGLAYVCAHQEPYGGEEGCGLYFCHDHLTGGICERCAGREDHATHIAPFAAKPDHTQWIEWKLVDPSWKDWREQNPDKVAMMRADLIARIEGNRTPIDGNQQKESQ
jgi:hypothetical protein